MMDDLLIVGGGPVGLGTAIYAALAGLSVRVLEARPGVIDKACGEGIMPGGVAALMAMGVPIETYCPFKGIRYIANGRQATGHFSTGIGWGIRRLVLHAGLRQRALQLGVRIVTHRVQAVQQYDAYVMADHYAARYLVAADGLKSPIRKQLHLEQPVPAVYARYGLRQHFQVKAWTDNYVEIHLSSLAEAYVTPVSEDVVGVALLFGDALRRKLHGTRMTFYQRVLEEFPLLKAHCTQPCSRIQGAGPFKTVAKQHVLGRVLLVGDAAGYLDPVTGEGIRLGLATARAAITAILHNTPQAYEQQWQQLTRRYWLVTSAVLAIRQYPLLSRLIVPTLDAFPRLFDWTLEHMEK